MLIINANELKKVMSQLKLKLVTIHYGNPDSGVSKKVIYQVQALRNNNIDARVVILGDAKREDFKYEYIDVIPTKTPPYRSLGDKLAGVRSLRKSFEQVLLEGDDDEVIMLRVFVPAWWMYQAIKRSKKKVVLELLSSDFQEALLRKSYLYYISLCLFYTRILRSVDLIVSVTQEILEQHFNIKKYKIPYLVIGNGIRVDSVQVNKRKRNTVRGEYNLTCVAQISPWHGLDRLMEGLRRYKGNDVINFHIVGTGSALSQLKELAEKLGLKNVFFHGFLSGKELDDILEATDLAISTLAIHRINIRYLSVLKSREYCARGIPFVYAGFDDDFPPEFPYVLQTELSEDPIDIELIVSFLKKLESMPDYSNKMRKHAEEVLSWDVKMARLAARLKEIV